MLLLEKRPTVFFFFQSSKCLVSILNFIVTQIWLKKFHWKNIVTYFISLFPWNVVLSPLTFLSSLLFGKVSSAADWSSDAFQDLKLIVILHLHSCNVGHELFQNYFLYVCSGNEVMFEPQDLQHDAVCIPSPRTSTKPHIMSS